MTPYYDRIEMLFTLFTVIVSHKSEFIFQKVKEGW